jgi:hypothetical protein
VTVAIHQVSRIRDQRDFAGPLVDGQYVRYDGTTGTFVTAAVSAPDLSTYATLAYVNGQLANYVTAAGLTATLAGYALLAGGNTFAGGNTINTGGTGTVGLVVNGPTGQTVDLQQWKVNAATLTSIDQLGDVVFSSTHTNALIRAAAAGGSITLRPGSSGSIVLGNVTSSGASGVFLPVQFTGTASQSGTAGATFLTVQPTVTAMGSGAYAGVRIQMGGTLGGGVKAVQIQQAAIGTQAADMTRWETNGGVLLCRVAAGGRFGHAVTTAPADADVATGEAQLWFDSTNGAAKLMCKAKSANGTVVTGQLALA